MSLEGLINQGNAEAAAKCQGLRPGFRGISHFTYLLWDMQPKEGWLSNEHPRQSALPSSRWRPLYLGKAAGWGSVKRHLTKDEFGCGARLPTDKNAINEGLLAYCLTKSQPGWLAISVIPHATALAAQQLEQDGVRHLGWRRDVRLRKKLTPAQVKSSIAAGQNEWKRTLYEVKFRYSDLLSAPTPADEGLLFNQAEPAPDGRGQ